MQTQLKYVHLVPHVWESLERLPRTGWVKRKVVNPETVALHTVDLRLMAIPLLEQIPELSDSSKQRVLDCLEIHDWPEYHPELGDIPAPEHGKNGYMTRKEKKKLERKIMVKICEPLGDVGQGIMSLWNELDEGLTLVAQLVHQLDKMQPILKAISYEEAGELPGMAQGFYDYAQAEIVHPVLRQHFDNAVRITNTIN